MNIQNLLNGQTVLPGIEMQPPTGGESFSSALKNALESTNTAQHHADDKLQAIASGEDVDLHGTMVAMHEADITLRAMTSVRDKVLDAYQQVMNMTI